MSSRAAGGDAQQMLSLLVSGLVIAVAFGSVFLAAMRSPAPHGVPIAVIGSPGDVAAVERVLEQQDPGAFHFAPYSSEAEATQAVHRRDLYATLDLSRPVNMRIVMAGANGTGLSQTLTTMFTSTAQALGRSTTLTDVAPLPTRDSHGLSVYYYVFGLGQSSYLFATACHRKALAASRAARAVMPLAFSVVVGVTLAAVADAGFGALPGHPWKLAAMSILICSAITSATNALGRLLGSAGIAVSGLLFIILSNATSGGSLNWHFLPGGWRWISQMMPAGAGVTGLWNIQYFGTHNLGPAVLSLITWTTVSLFLLVALPESRLHKIPHGRTRDQCHRRRSEPHQISPE